MNSNRRINRNLKNVIKYAPPKSVNMNIMKPKNGGRDMIITGKDLIVPNNNSICIPNGAYFYIPCNPVYWNDTRAKNIAMLNQFYIIRKLSIEYVPTVSKFQQGIITLGCVSNITFNINNMQSGLIASTDGSSFSCSEHFVKSISLSSLITQKKLLISPKFDKESVPFFIAILTNGVVNNNGQPISPGTFYLNYDIKFFNPIAKPLNYFAAYNIKITEIEEDIINTTLVLLTSSSSFEIGTIIDYEKVDEENRFYYNGTQVELEDDVYVSAFYNNDNKEKSKHKIDVSNYIELQPPQVSMKTVLQNEYLIIINMENQDIGIYRNLTEDVIIQNIPPVQFITRTLITTAIPEDITKANININDISKNSLGMTVIQGELIDCEFIL